MSVNPDDVHEQDFRGLRLTRFVDMHDERVRLASDIKTIYIDPQRAALDAQRLQIHISRETLDKGDRIFAVLRRHESRQTQEATQTDNAQTAANKVHFHILQFHRPSAAEHGVSGGI